VTDAVEFRDRAAYLPDADAVVVADFHVGRDRTSSVELPLGEREDLVDRLAGVLSTFAPAELVLGGDLLHAFDSVPEGTPETVGAIRETVADSGAELVVVRGNHDPMLESVYDGPVHDEYRLADGETLVCHGHEAPDADAARYVAGHDHPAIEIEGRRRPCFLHGRGVYRGADVLLLPAFNRLASGTPINGATGADLLSPLAAELARFRPIVRDTEAEETLEFPPLGQFRRLL
jgi:putative SbcD/Mre11-related phosphoesterase